MGVARFRAWFGERGATEEDLGRIEDIEVMQEMDAIWEARIRISTCLDERGTWHHRPDELAKPFSRIRIEIDAGSGRFVPLIDGPVASFENALDSQPSRSTATLVVRDDSVFLNRDEDVEVFEDRKDSDIADEVFKRAAQIRDTRIESTTGTNPSTVRRGTPMQFLRELARANDRHAFVLPGEKRGESVGCFLPDPKAAGDLPKLVLLGDGRMLANVRIHEESEGPERTRGRTLRLDDLSEASFETSAIDLGLMRDLPAVPEDLTPLRLLPPADAIREDPEPAVTSQAHDAAYAFHLSSQIIPGCYTGVLTPYQKVKVEAGQTPYSGEYLITKVVHRINLSVYTQEFEAKSDSRTDVQSASVAEAPGGGLSVSFSASVSIF
jgi:hypothetical protein